MSILNVEHVSHSFGGRSILEDVSFRLLKGEHVGLIGANGEGKLFAASWRRKAERWNGVGILRPVIWISIPYLAKA